MLAERYNLAWKQTSKDAAIPQTSLQLISIQAKHERSLRPISLLVKKKGNTPANRFLK